MSKGGSRFSRLGVLAPAALSACVDASVLAAPAAGAILSTILKELSKAFMLKKWFHGIMSAQEAEQLLLQKGKQGSYLVRESRANPGKYVLSVRTRARVSHVMIRKEQNKYHVGSGEVFEDLTGLIEHCRAYPLSEATGEILRLRQPVGGSRTRLRSNSDKGAKILALETSRSEVMEPNPDVDRQLLEIFEKMAQEGYREEAKCSECEAPDDTHVILEMDSTELGRHKIQYDQIKGLDKLNTFTKIEGKRDVNRYKNRYRDVIPYDQTRVHLPSSSSSFDEVFTDYINASYIRPQWMFDKIAHRLDSTTDPLSVIHGADWEDVHKMEEMSESLGAEEGAGMITLTDETALRKKCQTEAGIVNDKFYIAAQGCLPLTRHSFWAMVADNDVRVIAMLTNCFEDGMNKCDAYWPSLHNTETIGDLKVTNDCEYYHPDYISRQLLVETSDHRRTTVYQYQFTTWPDHSTPLDIKGLLRYIRDVNLRMKAVAQEKNAPKHNIMCVHCSAGVGRTGTLIALDMLFDIAKMNGVLREDEEIPNTVVLLRKQRPCMVQNLGQFSFLYAAVRAYIAEADTSTSPEPPF